jgi:hypothetical protein
MDWGGCAGYSARVRAEVQDPAAATFLQRLWREPGSIIFPKRQVSLASTAVAIRALGWRLRVESRNAYSLRFSVGMMITTDLVGQSPLPRDPRTHAFALSAVLALQPGHRIMSELHLVNECVKIKRNP